MEAREEKKKNLTCKKCGSPVDLYANADLIIYEPAVNSYGIVSIEDLSVKINYVGFISCRNPECGAVWEETGWELYSQNNKEIGLVETE